MTFAINNPAESGILTVVDALAITPTMPVVPCMSRNCFLRS